jgi:hypothetical protein
MSGVSVARGDNWVRVSNLSNKVSAHAGRSSVGTAVFFDITLDESDEILLHRGDVEVYVSLERLSELHETLGVFIKEAKLLLGEKP